MTTTALQAARTEAIRSRTPLENAWRRLRRHRSARIGMAILAFLVLLAIFAPVLAPYDPLTPLPNTPRRTPPCIHALGCPADQPEHIFGVDGNSRDLFSRVLF